MENVNKKTKEELLEIAKRVKNDSASVGVCCDNTVAEGAGLNKNE